MKKPSDLIIPFSFEDRKPIIIDRLLFIPDHYYKHDVWGGLDLSDEKVFNEKRPVNVEYCSGNGQWIIDKAQKNSDINWIAVEYDFDRARKIWVKMHNLNIDNLFVVMGEAHTFTKYYLADNSINNIFINFPDPWPKEKHAKNRLVNSAFMKEVSIVVKQEGKATLVTDDEDAKDWMLEATLLSNKWKSVYEAPYFIDHLESYGGSYFDDLWRSKGKKIKYLQFLNTK